MILVINPMTCYKNCSIYFSWTLLSFSLWGIRNHITITTYKGTQVLYFYISSWPYYSSNCIIILRYAICLHFRLIVRLCSCTYHSWRSKSGIFCWCVANDSEQGCFFYYAIFDTDFYKKIPYFFSDIRIELEARLHYTRS